jgi:hypothetical protein
MLKPSPPTSDRTTNHGQRTGPGGRTAKSQARRPTAIAASIMKARARRLSNHDPTP